MSFARRLLLAFWALALLICLLFSLFAMAFAYTVEDRLLERQLAQEAARLQAGHAATGEWPPPSQPQYRLVGRADELPDGIAAQLVQRPQRREFAGAGGRHYHLQRLDGAWLVAEVSEGLVVRPEREGLLGWLALWTLGMTTLALLLGTWLARRLADPLQRLAQRLRQAGPDALPQDLAPSLRSARPAAEIEQLAIALDALHARTHAFIAREQAFTRDASHELRTPLAVLKLGLAHDRPDGAERSRMRRAVQQLEQTLDALLWLAREDAGEPASSAVLPLVEQWALDHAEALEGRALRLDLPRGLRLALPEPALRLVLANLLGNALAHGQGDIELSAEPGDTLCVANAGAALPPGAGQPFVKGAASAGFGLGLSIVQRLLERHGARLVLAHEQGRTTVRVAGAAVCPARR